MLKFGTMRALVAGIEAVLPDGSVHNGLCGLKKDNRGYSLDQLLIGAEGTLGVVTAVALRLVPAIAARAVAWAGVESPAARAVLLRFLEARTRKHRRLRAGRGDSLRARAQAHSRHARAAGGQHPLACADRSDHGGCVTRHRRGAGQLLGAALEQGSSAMRCIAANEAQAEAFWKIRDTISEAERAEGQTLAHDISVAVADMPAFIIEASAEVERAFPGRGRERLWSSRRRQHPLSRPRRQPRGARLV